MFLGDKLNQLDDLKQEIDLLRPLSDYELKELKAFYKICFTYKIPAIDKENHPVIYAAKLHKKFVWIHLDLRSQWNNLFKEKKIKLV